MLKHFLYPNIYPNIIFCNKKRVCINITLNKNKSVHIQCYQEHQAKNERCISYNDYNYSFDPITKFMVRNGNFITGDTKFLNIILKYINGVKTRI